MKKKQHLSFSGYNGYLKCPQKQYALDTGKFVFETTQAMIAGKYLEHLLCPKDLPVPEGVLTQKGEPYAWAKTMSEAAERILANKFLKSFLVGKKQVEITFKLNGINWISIPDVVDYKSGKIVDIKKTKSINEWSYSQEHGTRVPFWTERNYFLQLAIAQEAVFAETGKRFDCYLLAVSAETPSQIAPIKFEQADLDYEIDNLLYAQGTVYHQRSRGKNLWYCGECEFCRANKPPEVIVARRFANESN